MTHICTMFKEYTGCLHSGTLYTMVFYNTSNCSVHYDKGDNAMFANSDNAFSYPSLVSPCSSTRAYKHASKALVNGHVDSRFKKPNTAKYYFL